MQKSSRQTGGLGKITERLFQMEDDLDLFNQRIGGIYFWERIRFGVHRKILEEVGLSGQAHTKLKPTLSYRATRMSLALRNTLLRNPFFASSSDLVFMGHPRRKLQEDGKWWDIYIDPIIGDLDLSYTYFESSYLNKHLAPAKTVGIRYLDIIDVLAGIESRLRVTRIHLSRLETELLLDIRKEIRKRFDVDVALEDTVKSTLLTRKSTLPLYKMLLRKIAPKLAIVVVGYGKETFIEACKELRIPVIELQHGVVNYYHLGYSYPGPKRIKRCFADYFFSFGDYWKECVEFPIKKDRVYSVGYPYLELEAKKYADVPRKDQILFISQGTVGKEMSKFAVKLSKSHSLKQNIVYKLHPGEYARWKKEYPWLVDADIRVIEDDNIPLYQLFAESRIQIGVNSTAIYEGLNFGLRTFLLNLPGVEYMEDLAREHYASIAESVDELQEYLKSPDPATQIGADKFFRRNALENIHRALHEIIASSREGKA